MEFTPIKRQKIYEEIVDQIYKMLIESKFEEGSKLPPEGALAERFGVSKTVVREALSVLKTNGVIESRPGSGNFIRKIDGGSFVSSISTSLLNKEALIEILELRRALEIEAASLAAERATEEDIKKLLLINHNLKEATTLEDAIEQDFSLHESIFHATHNSAFVTVFISISSLIKNAIKESKIKSKKIPGRQLEGVREHFEIIEAIKEKDDIKARDKMRSHLENNELKTLNIDIKKSKNIFK
ncbi:FadR/GntR family transcriptional regulator [Fictibacillus enclensis]|uniref:FadR/GntR family transcriptional regulator n=1 Tax=Fictibacillus enclensis TaxID=1017270 RepID=UPI0024BF4973|nr:FadR/GntR family transcriptional regulator [Fictibacillus enclensis]WHY70545.1 FadR/GntR family transcriptional regulator [Fictibacillus enclensis]